MAVATGTALLIGAGISAGTQIAGAKMASGAAGNAADQQVAATDKGLALQQQIYGQQVQGMQPYAQVGQQALGSLGSLMGFPALPPGGVPGSPGGPALGPVNGQQGPMNVGDPRVQHLAQGGSLMDPEVSGQGTIGAATRSGYSSTGTAVPRGGSFGPQMVKLQAPTGEVGEFPEDQAGQFIARGARRV